MRRAILTEIVRKNVKKRHYENLHKTSHQKSMAAVPKIPNDRREADAVDGTLAGCSSAEMMNFR